jgi:coenzyme F420-dependent glucose-6-phosphate dehydrogenase
MFPPSHCLEQAVRASKAGFDGIGCSDHFQPWWPDGQSRHAWVWLGAAGQAIANLPIGTAVTATVHRYHPGLVAQAWMTLEEMFPGRTFLGVGSGEALNEVPLGAVWPSPAEKIQRMDHALEVITRLWAGETVTYDAGWFRLKEAKLSTRATGRPKLYVSAFGPTSAQVAGKWADGVWTLGDPQKTPAILDAYRAACSQHDRSPGEVILQSGFAWAETDKSALDGIRVWGGTLPREFYSDDWHAPAAMQQHAKEQKLLDDEALRQAFIVGADPNVHVERIRQMQDLGATVIALQNMSGADPMGTIDVYREQVLPAVKGAWV